MTEFHLPLYADTLSDGVGVVSASGILHAANEALAHMLAYESKERLLSGTAGGSIFLSHLDRQELEQQAGDGAAMVGRQCALQMRSGTALTVGVTALKRPDGMFDAVFVQDRETGSPEIVRLRELLRRTQQHMAQTDRAKAVGTLSGLLAHELNNVFGSVIGRAQLMQMRTSDERLLRECEYIVQAAEQGVGEVKRLLQFIHKSRQQSYGPMCVEDIFDEACAVIEPAIDRCRTQRIPVTITKNFERHAKVFGYVPELREILAHLLHNALDAMPDGGRITASCNYTAGDFSLTIADTGTGIANEVLEKMYEPMFTTKDEQRSGMGLTIVKELLRKMKGSIAVTTEPGKGSVFTVSLPKTEVKPDEPSHQVQNRQNELETRFVSRILIVDDDESVLISLDKFLSSKGFVTKAMLDSCEAVRVAGSFQPDVIITDLAMPGLNGWELAKQMRAICPSSKIILTTAFTDMVSDVEMKQTAVDVVMEKPVNIQELINTILSV